MNIFRNMIEFVASFAALDTMKQLSCFMASHSRTRAVQDELLRELIRKHAFSEFGRDHNFKSIRSYEDFRKAVPIGDYETFRPYIRKVQHGRISAMLSPYDKVLMFSTTSGTTGKPKYIPVTNHFLEDIRRGWNVFGLKVMSDHPKAWLRKIVQISSSMHEGISPTGVPCGAVSGLLARTQKRIVRHLYVVPNLANDIRSPADKYYTILRCSIAHDVSVITTANPSSTIKMVQTGQSHAEQMVKDIRDGTITPPEQSASSEFTAGLKFKKNPSLAKHLDECIERDGMLLPKHFWNIEFLTNWTGGTVGLYIPKLKELFPGAAVRDIGLLASEGRFSVPLWDDTPSGVAEILGNFLEFIPAEQRTRENPDTLRADELTEGQEYFLVFSNWTGLFRYNLDDRVRVTGKLGTCPIFEFLSRGLHTSSITGEKLTEYQVVQAMKIASKKTGLKVTKFVVQGHFCDHPYYELRFDQNEQAAPLIAEKLASELDAELSRLNIEYESKRTGGRLGEIRAVLLPAGTLERTEIENIKKRSGRGEQYKHRYLDTEISAE